MKHLKKLASIVLALVMVLAMAIPVMAADPTGKITINNATVGETYNVYKIFDLKSYDPQKNQYSYTVAEGWSDFIESEKNTFVVIENGYVVVEDPNEVAKFAKEAIEYAQNNNIRSQGEQTPVATTEDQKTTTVVFDNLPLGYYLVDSTVGALCSLDTTNPEVTMNDKNVKPKLEKEVKEGGAFGKWNDAELGEKVEFQATIIAQPGAQNFNNYVMHDKMTNLNFSKVNSITLNGNAITEGMDYVVKQAGLTDECTFEVEFTESFCDKLNANDVIIVSYEATVDAKAEIAGEGNPNEAYLEYDDTQTTTSTTKTYVWSFNLNKRDGKDPTQTPLPYLSGVEFALNSDTEGTRVKFIQPDPNNPNLLKVDPNGTIKSFTTNGNQIQLEGLDEGTYYLEELDAPNGYNKLQDTVPVTIRRSEAENGTVTSTIEYTINDEKKTHDSDVDIVNNTGVELPGTGGIGTTIFYIVGGILVVGAAVILVSKKRTKDE